MYKGKRIIAIIPARSGSKGLKDKNIRELCGKPLMSYTIDAAIETNICDVVHVSTDSPKYAEIAQKFGASVPWLRSPELATDQASSWDVISEVLGQYKKIGKDFDIVVLLQPTSPLRSSQDIVQAVMLLDKKKGNAVVSVCKAEHSPKWAGIISEAGSMELFGVENEPRQRLQQYHRLNGAVYALWVKYFMTEFKNQKTVYDKKCYAYVMPTERSIDIDDITDFKLAEALMKTFNI